MKLTGSFTALRNWIFEMSFTQREIDQATLVAMLREMKWQRTAIRLLARKLGEDPGELFKAADAVMNGEAEG